MQAPAPPAEAGDTRSASAPQPHQARPARAAAPAARSPARASPVHAAARNGRSTHGRRRCLPSPTDSGTPASPDARARSRAPAHHVDARGSRARRRRAAHRDQAAGSPTISSAASTCLRRSRRRWRGLRRRRWQMRHRGAPQLRRMICRSAETRSPPRYPLNRCGGRPDGPGRQRNTPPACGWLARSAAVNFTAAVVT